MGDLDRDVESTRAATTGLAYHRDQERWMFADVDRFDPKVLKSLCPAPAVQVHHRGRPHFHATYSGDEASVDIETLEIIAGELPSRARQLVSEWARLHESELRENWERARRHESLQPIEPLR